MWAQLWQLADNLVYPRDMFIPDELKPRQKPVDETTLTYIFNVFDEMLEVTCNETDLIRQIRALLNHVSVLFQPTPEMIEKAYSHYNKVLHKKVY